MRLAVALRELGRIERTLFIVDQLQQSVELRLARCKRHDRPKMLFPLSDGHT